MEFQTFDAAYVARLTAGDPETEAHFSAYFERFLSLKLRARSFSRTISDDVRQETLYRVLKVVRQGAGVQDPSRFGAFVNSICNNVLLEFLHKRTRDEPSGDALPEPRANLAAADEALITQQRKKAVANIISGLPARDREILRLVFFEEVDREEICRRLGVDAGYVRVLLHRAKARFEAAFQNTYRHFACLTLLLCNAIATCLTIPQIPLLIGGSAWITNTP